MKQSLDFYDLHLKAQDIIVFKNGTEKTVIRYNGNNHRIFYDDGSFHDLWVIYDSIFDVILSNSNKPTTISSSLSLESIIMEAISLIIEKTGYKVYKEILLSFIKGDKNSYIFDKCNNCSFFGAKPNIAEEELTEAIEQLLDECKIIKKINKKGRPYFEPFPFNLDFNNVVAENEYFGTCIVNIVLELEAIQIDVYLNDFLQLPSKNSEYYPFINSDEIETLQTEIKKDKKALIKGLNACLILNLLTLIETHNDKDLIVKTTHLTKSLIQKKDNWFKNPLEGLLNGSKNTIHYNDNFLKKMPNRIRSNDINIDFKGNIYSFCNTITVCPYSSNLELNLLDILISSKCFKEIRTQCICIDYKKRNRSNEYIPDIVAIDQNNVVCVIEGKPLYNMVNERNMRKYKNFSSYCEKHGYLYLMCDDKLNTLETLKTYKIDAKLLKDLVYMLDHNLHGKIVESDVKRIIKKYKGTYSKEEIITQISATVYQYNLYLKGDLAICNKIIISRKKNSLI